MIAYVVMGNHYHLIVHQGAAPLARLMQPINERIALMLQRRLRRGGHIFERRYQASPCADPDYLRHAIAYTHLNPVRAGLCETAAAYTWSSHYAYAGLTQPAHAVSNLVPELIPVVGLFRKKSGGVEGDCGAYEEFLAWRRACDLAVNAERPAGPICCEGDAYWASHFGAAARRVLADTSPTARPDLRDLVRNVLRESSPRIGIEQLRLRRFGPQVVALRHAIIKRAILAGFRSVDIAHHLKVSEPTISRVAKSFLAEPVGREEQPSQEMRKAATAEE
jgi:hypothetical protein